MNLATALQRLANYRTKNTNARASRQIFESGIVVLRNNALHKLGDDCASSLLTLNNHFFAPTRLTTPLKVGSS